MWNFLIALVGIAFYCYMSPFFHLVDPISYSINLPAKLDGALSQNDKLENVERLHENALHWPESFAVHNNKIYTGLGDGRIVQVTDKKITEVTRTGSSCSGQHEEHICGRPLGMTFSKTGRLYSVDAYHGVFSIDPKTGKKNHILSSKSLVDGVPLTLLNSIALDEKEQVLYLTQSSSKWNISHVMVSIIEHDSSGRLLKYNLKTKEITVILKNLAFPNGVETTHDGSAVLVAIGCKNKIIKYFINGEKKGQHTTLPLVLPGEPDNISKSKNGNYWVPVATARSLENPNILDKFAEQPLLRKGVLFAHRIIITPIAVVMKLLPYQWVKEMAAELQTGRIIADYIPTHGMVIEFDDNGKVIRSFHSPSGKTSHISEVLEHNGYLYLGSWRNRYIGRLKL